MFVWFFVDIMEIRIVVVGIVVIKGVESEYYFVMNKEGKFYVKVLIIDKLLFKFILLKLFVFLKIEISFILSV